MERVTRYPRKLVVHEEPTVVDLLEALAIEHGHSTAAEVRAAIREHLATEDRSKHGSQEIA